MNSFLIDVIVPIYNSSVANVPVVKAVEKSSIQCKIHICDNSDHEEYKAVNKSLCMTSPYIEYFDMGGNVGISKAYNYALKYCKGDIVCIFDDDTFVKSDYFEKVAQKVLSNGSGIYLPVVVAEDGRVLSPLNSFGPAIFPYKHISDFNPNRCFAFNTGLAATRDVFSVVRYDEHLFIEWVDHAFCRDAHKAGISFNMVNEPRLVQNYSRDSNNLKAALHREALAGPDLREFYSGSIRNKLYGLAYRMYRVLKCSIKYRTLSFFKCY